MAGIIRISQIGLSVKAWQSSARLISKHTKTNAAASIVADRAQRDIGKRRSDSEHDNQQKFDSPVIVLETTSYPYLSNFPLLNYVDITRDQCAVDQLGVALSISKAS